jgi:hypothetical protein
VPKPTPSYIPEDQDIKNWIGSRNFTTSYSNDTGLLTIVSKSNDPQDPYVHTWNIGSRPYPYIYVDYSLKEAPFTTISSAEVNFIYLSEFVKDKGLENMDNYVQNDQYSWYLTYNVSSSLGTTTVNFEMVAYRSKASKEIFQKFSGAVSSDRYNLNNQKMIDPCTMFINYEIMHFPYGYEDSLIALWISSSTGKWPLFTNETSNQYGFGDAWFDWRDNHAGEEWMQVAAHNGPYFQVFPISHIRRDPTTSWVATFTHNLFDITRRETKQTALQVDDWTQSVKFKEWAERRHIDYTVDPINGDTVYASFFRQGTIHDRQIHRLSPMFDFFDVWFQSNEFISYHQGFYVSGLSCKTRGNKTFEFNRLPDSAEMDHGQWTDPDTGGKVYVHQFSGKWSDDDVRQRNVIKSMFTMYVVTDPMVYHGMKLIPSKPIVVLDFDFSECLAVRTEASQLVVSLNMLSIDTTWAMSPNVESSRGFMEWTVPVVDGVEFEDSFIEKLNPFDAEDVHMYNIATDIPKAANSYSRRLEVNVDVPRALSQEGLNVARKYFGNNDTVIITQNEKDGYLSIEIKDEDRNMTNHYYIQTKPKLSITSHLYSTQPYQVYEYSKIVLVALRERTVSSDTRDVIRPVNIFDDRPWKVKVTQRKDEKGNDVVSFLISKWAEETDGLKSSHFKFEFGGEVSNDPEKFKSLDFVLGAPFYRYETEHSRLETIFESSIVLADDMSAHFGEYGSAHDVVYESSVERAGGITHVRLSRKGETRFFYRKKHDHE